MRNFWVAIIGVLTITLFAGTSFATAPMVQDIPDFKLLTGSQLIDDFDLNGYVTDYDDPAADLSWTMDATFNASLSGTGSHLLDIAGSSTPGYGVNAFRVHDATQSDAQSVDTSVVKYSSIMVTGPGLTQDNNLVPPDAFVRTWVVEASRTLTTPAISTLITPSGVTPDLFVSIADLNGTLLAGDNTAEATSGDLHAVINGDGELELSAPAGSYPTFDPLTGAYRVGIKAKLSGSGLATEADANWDGAELLVSTSRIPSLVTVGGLDLAKVDRFNNFEVDTVGALPTTAGLSRGLAEGQRSRWYCTTASTGTGAIVASVGVPTSVTTTWATSGNALKASMTAAGQKVIFKSETFTDLQPGEKLTFQANVTTTVPAGGKPLDVWMFIGATSGLSSNYQGTFLGAGTNPLANTQAPIGGAAGWRTLKAEFVADTFGAAVASGTSTVNFYGTGTAYVAAGYQATIIVVAPTGVTYPADAYIDNVRIYRSGTALENALAATEVPVVVKGSINVFDGTIESATDETNGGAFTVTRKSGNTATAVLNNNVGDNSPFHAGSKSLAIYVGNDTLTSTNGAVLVRATLDLVTPSKNYGGPGIYGFSFWFKTDAPDVASCPGVWAQLADNTFKNIPFADVGYVGCPLAGQGWKKVEVTSARVGTTPNALWASVNVRSANPTYTNRAWWGEFNETAKVPGAQEDAKVFIDDLKIHKVQDEATYFDRSVFPVAD